MMKSRLLSILLTLCIMMSFVPTSVFAEGEAAPGPAAIQLGTEALNKNVNTANTPTVYFGQNHENNPAAWRVIGYDGSGVTSTQGDMTLLAAGNMGVVKFADTIANNKYAPSNLKTAIDALAEKLTTDENAAVKKRTLASGSYDGENTDCVAGAQVDNAVFWPLSIAEASAVNNDLRIADKEHTKWVSSYWWLRSPGSSAYVVAVVKGNGSVSCAGHSLGTEIGVRPAFKLNLNSVLFASAAVGGKPDGGLTEVPEYNGSEWKLTLLDSSRNFAVTEKTADGYPDDTIMLNYSGATTGANEYISVIIADNNGAQYYGRVAQPTAESGTVEIKIPSDLAPGSYTLKVFNELYNGDYKTDYASNFTDIALTVENQPDEQFTLSPGGRYYFDLSGVSIPGTANSGNSNGAASLPDTSLHYVPFTYAGTIEAYKLTSEMETTEEYAEQNKYPHSLFIADYVVTNDVSWDTLNTANLIFGKNYAGGGVDYTLRAPSVGSSYTGSGDSERGTPQSNEWDTMLNKNSGYIQNWNKMYSWGQDVSSGFASYRARRGYSSARNWYSNSAPLSNSFLGFRPVLEVPNPGTLGSDGMKVVTLALGGGKLGGSSDAIQIIVKNGSEFTAPASDGLNRPDGNTGSYFMWLGSDGKLYAPGASVPADVTKLTAQWRDIAVPTGEIKIAENGWKSFFNTITFDLFFKDTQMVTVTAADNSGEAVTVEYLLSEKALAESELARMTFTAYSAPFSINADNEYVIYAKLTDTSGNVAYINTNGIVLDATVPVISGIEAGKTYCAAQTVTVTEKYISTVKVNGTEVILDENSQFALSPASGEQTIVVTDKAGNETRVTVTVNDGHTYEWQSENGQYWQKCKFCNHETAKKDIPTININGADKVCRTQDYKFGFTLPEGATDAACGYEFIGLGGAPLTPTVENGLYSGIIKASTYPAKENIFKLIVSVKTADGFEFSAEKKVTIQNEHTGGTATCKDKAKCEICGESYGKLDSNNHANLKHIDAKAATKTSEGNIEYWYCDGCNKYYKDAKATQEITKAQTVTAKLPDDSKSLQTGDNSNLALWIALLFISGGAVTVTTVYGRKKKRLTK
jgi:hypothetical protein